MGYLLLLSAVVPSLVLMWLFVTSDEYPEPVGAVVGAFVVGALIIPVFFIFSPAMDWLQEVARADDPLIAGAGKAFLVAAIPEETFKYLALLLFTSRLSAFDEPMDGIVYGVAVSLGFATVENIFYVFNVDDGLGTALSRAVTVVPAHAMFGAIMGYYYGRGVFSTHLKPSLYLKALAVPILLHGLYDLPPMTFDAANDLDAKLSEGIFFALYLLFLFVVQFQIKVTARSLGILKREQRRRMVSDGAGGEAAGMPLGKGFALVFDCAAIFVLLVVGVAMARGTADVLEGVFHLALAAILALQATRYRKEYLRAREAG